MGGFLEVSLLIVTARMSEHYVVAYRPKTFVACGEVGTLCFYSTVDFSIASNLSYTR